MLWNLSNIIFIKYMFKLSQDLIFSKIIKNLSNSKSSDKRFISNKKIQKK